MDDNKWSELRACLEEKEISLKNLQGYRYAKMSKKECQKRNELLLETLKQIDCVDLITLFYIHNIKALGRFTILKSLRATYQSQLDLKNKISNTNEKDPMR